MLEKAYHEFINYYDPYSQDEQPETLEGMFYNLLEIKPFIEDTEDPELITQLEKTIALFEKEGIKA